MDAAQQAALAKLSRMEPLRLLPHLVSTGMPHADKHEYGNRVSEAQRQGAEVRMVPIDQLHAVQSGVDPRRLRHFIESPGDIVEPGRRNASGYTTDMPIVVDHAGKLYLHDGHHRAVARRLMGETSVKARVVKIGAGGALRAWAKS